MKLRNILFASITAAALVSFSSCLKEQRDYFDEPASERLDNYVENVRKVLCDYTAGWVMDYYTGTDQQYGGYAYVLKFGKNDVEVFSEIAMGKSEKTLYKFTKDNGPVLSFDTYNSIMHYFATPSSTLYEAYGGDFEFTIMGYSDTEVRLLGKRSNNYCTLHPLPEGTTPEEYLEQVVNISENFKASELDGTIGTMQVHGSVDLNNRRITLTEVRPEGASEDDSEEGAEEDDPQVFEIPFIFTPDGIRTYKEVEIGGCKFQDVTYLIKNNLITNGIFTLKGKVPEDYSSYNDFIGTFTLKYYYGNQTITLAADEKGTGYILSGLNSNFTLRLGYDKARGRATLVYQNLGITTGTNYAAWMPWDADSGYLTWMEGVGVEIYRDVNDESGNKYLFCDNGVWEGYNVNSFIIYECDSAGNRIGAYKDWGRYQYPYFESITRK